MEVYGLEEKKAIEVLNNKSPSEQMLISGKMCVNVLLNLIEKQQAEIEELKEDMSNMYDEKVVRNILEDECGLSKYEIDEILN